MIRLASSMSSSLPVSFHQPSMTWGRTMWPLVDQPLDRVGDLELAARRRLDGLDRLEDRRVEHVDADQRQIGGRHPSASRPGAPPARPSARRRRTGSGRARARAGSGCWASRRGSARPAGSSRSRIRLSPRYMQNGSVPRNGSETSTACARPERGLLLDVRDRHPEPAAVPDRVADLLPGVADHDPDLADPGGSQRLDPVEEDGLVGDRNELLGRRERDRTEPGAAAPGED